MTNDEPTFQVQKIETSHDTMTALVPQFQPSDLSEDERTAYDGLREAGKGHHSGAIAVVEIAESRFEAGETVTFHDVAVRYKDAGEELVDQLRPVLVDFMKQIAPVMNDLTEAIRPLAEAQQEIIESTERD